LESRDKVKSYSSVTVSEVTILRNRRWQNFLAVIYCWYQENIIYRIV